MRNFLLLLFLANSFISFGQITKKNWLVGGTGNFSSRNGTFSTPSISYDSKYTDLTIAPNVGYFVIDKLAAGLRTSFVWTKSKTYPPGGGSTNMNRFAIGPFLRYYFFNSENRVNLVADAHVQVGRIKAGVEKGSIANYGFMAGPVVFFNSVVGFEFLVGYNANIEDVKNSYKNNINGFNINAGFQIHLEK